MWRIGCTQNEGRKSMKIWSKNGFNQMVRKGWPTIFDLRVVGDKPNLFLISHAQITLFFLSSTQKWSFGGRKLWSNNFPWRRNWKKTSQGNQVAARLSISSYLYFTIDEQRVVGFMKTLTCNFDIWIGSSYSWSSTLFLTYFPPSCWKLI